MYVCTFATARRVCDQQDLTWLTAGSLHQRSSQVLLFGRSLGGAVAIALAAKNESKLRGIIVENTFRAETYMPWLLRRRRHRATACVGGATVCHSVPQCATSVRLYSGCALLLVCARVGGFSYMRWGWRAGVRMAEGSCACVPERACEQVSVCCMLYAWLSVLYRVMLCVQPHVRPALHESLSDVLTAPLQQAWKTSCRTCRRSYLAFAA